MQFESLVVEASFELESTNIYSQCALPPTARYTWLLFITIYQSINVKFFELAKCFTFRIIL